MIAVIKRIRWYLWVLSVLVVAYVGVSIYFMEHFFTGTEVNGVNADLYTVKQVNELLLSQANAYTLTITERGGDTVTLTPEKLGMSFSEGDTVRTLKRKQNGFLWPRMFWQKDLYQIGPEISYDEDAFDAAVDSCMKKGASPENAWVEMTEDGYKVHKEEQGAELDWESLSGQIRIASESLIETLDLDEAGCYVEPQITTESEEITSLTAQLDEWLGASVTYTFGKQSDVVDKSVISGFITIDDDYKATLSEQAVTDWVTELAKERDTYKQARSFNSTLRGTITVKGGNYGWQIDKATESAALLASIEKGETVTKEPAYSHKGNTWDGPNGDIGSTYIEVDMGAQHMWCYKNGTLVVDTDVVTGNISRGYNTPAIVSQIQYKTRNAVLKGDNYRTPVNYWMPFYGNYGIHDAYWRAEFGGEVYLTNGSHGCVNTPPAAMAQVYANMETGTPVVLYY